MSSEKDRLHVGKDWEDLDLDQIPETQQLQLQSSTGRQEVGAKLSLRVFLGEPGGDGGNFDRRVHNRGAGGPASVPLNQGGLKKHPR